MRSGEENIQHELDRRFKGTGVECISSDADSESLLQKEKDHVEGFAPEVGMGNTRRTGRAAGAYVRTSDFRDIVL